MFSRLHNWRKNTGYGQGGKLRFCSYVLVASHFVIQNWRQNNHMIIPISSCSSQVCVQQDTHSVCWIKSCRRTDSAMLSVIPLTWINRSFASCACCSEKIIYKKYCCWEKVFHTAVIYRPYPNCNLGSTETRPWSLKKYLGVEGMCKISFNFFYSIINAF